MRTDRRGRPGKRTEQRDRRSPSGDEWLYGRNAVTESLRANRRRFRQIVLLDSAGEDERLSEILQLARERSLSLKHAPRSELDTLAPDVNHQGVVTLATPYPYIERVDSEYAGSILALDHLVDPQNVGTLLRSAEAFGVRTVLLPRDRSARITPAVVNASAGAVEHLSIVPTVNLAQEIERLKKAGFWIVGVENDDRAEVLGSTSIPKPCVLIVGSEGQGMGPNLAKRCDLLLKMEMQGQVNSLNAATAGSIALFELSRV